MTKMQIGELDDALLGDGLDITGRQIEFLGNEWTVTGLNYVGDWDIERFEERPDGRYRIGSSISKSERWAKLISHS